MATSQNGWSVASAAQQDRAPLIRDVTVPNGVLAGDVAFVFRWLAAQYDRRVERLKAGQCWGWFVKPIEGSRTVSNHASGTAVDFNAPDNPMGVPTSRSMSAAQIAACRAIVRESDGVFRWGGDYAGRPDPMHWEIVGTRADVARLVKKIKGESSVTAPNAAQNATATWQADINPDPNVGSTAGGAVWTILARSNALNTLPGQIVDVRDRLAARVQDVDDELDGLGASIVLVVAILQSFSADPSTEPNPLYEVVRRAVRDELEAATES